MTNSWDDVNAVKYSDEYHCEHFTVDALKFLTGRDISPYMYSGTHAVPLNIRKFKQVKTPAQFTLVLMRDRSKAHIGIWYNNAVLHLSQHGAVLQTLSVAMREFKKVTFYEVDDEHI